jgi:RNA polymerase sigma-70 factor (ECF subfamily)
MPVAIADEELEAARRRGFGVAYRMLGSVSDAEDVAQEALLRLARAHGPIDDPIAWITTTATRLSIDVLRSAQVRRETYIGPWLPDPLIDDPADPVELADSLSQAFLVLLERLTPVERAVFLLREVFEYDYPRIARIVDRSEPNCRQLATRSRRHLQASLPRFDPDEAVRDRLLERFVAAAEEGDLAGLEALLAEDAVFYSDGGGKAAAVRTPLRGPAVIARAWAGITRSSRRFGPFEAQRVSIGGQPGRILRRPGGAVWHALTIDVVDGRIRTIRVMRNPDKLAHLAAGASLRRRWTPPPR